MPINRVVDQRGQCAPARKVGQPGQLGHRRGIALPVAEGGDEFQHLQLTGRQPVEQEPITPARGGEPADEESTAAGESAGPDDDSER